MALIDNVIAYWKLDESSGNPADSSGNGYTLSNVGTVGFIAGLINNGADFTPTGDSLNNNTVLAATTYPRTFQAWAKFDSLAGDDRTIFALGDGVTDYYVLKLRDSDNHIVFRSNNTTSAADIDTGVVATTGVWYHCVVVQHSSTSVSIYINNVKTNSIVATFTAVVSQFYLGYLGRSTTWYHDGLIDEVAIWNRALSDSEVTLLYNGGLGFSFSNYSVLVFTSAVSDIALSTALGTAEVLSDGGSTITERGFVWATTTNPTTANGKVSTTGTIGSYSASLTGLSLNTLYYVRSYYINGLGTTYGNEVTFTTLNIGQYELQKDIGAVDGQTYMGQINVTGTLGTITVQLGTTGTSTVINAGAGVSTFSGTYSGLSGLIITRSATFNGTIDNVYYAQVPLATTIDWSLDSVTIVTAINSSVFFKRIEDDVFNSFRFYRYLDLLFKDLDGYVTVTVRDEREDITTEREKTFSVGNVNPGTVSPFQKKRVSFLIKNQAVIIGLSNGNVGETFSIAQFLLTGHKKTQRMFAPSKIQSL